VARSSRQVRRLLTGLVEFRQTIRGTVGTRPASRRRTLVSERGTSASTDPEVTALLAESTQAAGRMGPPRSQMGRSPLNPRPVDAIRFATEKFQLAQLAEFRRRPRAVECPAGSRLRDCWVFLQINPLPVRRIGNADSNRSDLNPTCTCMPPNTY
jgi:hypothetical protein